MVSGHDTELDRDILPDNLTPNYHIFKSGRVRRTATIRFSIYFVIHTAHSLLFFTLASYV